MKNFNDTKKENFQTMIDSNAENEIDLEKNI